MNFSHGLRIILLVSLCLATTAISQDTEESRVTDEALRLAGQLIGIDFTQSERDTMLGGVTENLGSYEALRGMNIPNEIAPALLLDISPPPVGTIADEAPEWSKVRPLKRPDDLDDLAFYSIPQLGYLLRTGLVSSVELTRFCLDRLEKFGPGLECVITLLPERALEQAARADAEIAAGNYRGPLHGIPWGAKDLFAVAGAPTTWGCTPYKDQVIDETAAVVRRLDDAGAVLVAKLTLGALAWGDVWFGGTTKNPWNIEQGSSGSSAGSASAVSAGLVPFALGTETWGSIVSPCT